MRRLHHITQRESLHVGEIHAFDVDYDGACCWGVSPVFFDVVPPGQVFGVRGCGHVAAPFFGGVGGGLVGEDVEGVDEGGAVAVGGEGAGGWEADVG